MRILTLNDFGVSMEEAIERISIFAGKPLSQTNEDILSGEGLRPLPHKVDFYQQTAAKDNKNITNCRNCGAPVRSYICEYCGTVY